MYFFFLRSTAFTLAILILSLLLATACNTSDAQVSASKLDVTNPRLVTVQETGERSFSGTLINDNKQAITIVQVDVALYDQTGARVGTQMIEVEDVPADGEKDFRGVLDVDFPVQRARVISVATP